MNEGLIGLVSERAEGDASLGTEAALYVLASMRGDLSDLLVGDSPAAAAATPPAAPIPGAYLDHITVEGFRGVGPPATLQIEPGPGLTLVVGRNGSGKSSFTEGLEVLLTGKSRRWEGRSMVWREDWRNLHHPSPCIVEAGFLIEGTKGATSARREWADGAGLEDGRTEAQARGKKKTALSALGWTDALGTYRPFLSYNELGSMLDEGPSKLYDALSAILGLEDLVATERRLSEERKMRDKRIKDAEARVKAIRPRLEASDDERARRCLEATRKRPWDLESVQEALLGADGAAEEEGRLRLLRSFDSFALPDPAEVHGAAAALREAAKRLDAARTTDAERARQVAGLLGAALSFHADHGDSDCPVCGRADALDPAWRAASEEQIARLKAEAHEADDAHRAGDDARNRALRLLTAPPSTLVRAAEVGLGAEEVTASWSAWAAGRTIEDLVALAEHLDATVAPLTDSARDFMKKAAAELDRREDAWRPLAREIGAWVDDAMTAQEGDAAIASLKEAERWLQRMQEEIRDERFAPIADEAMANWELLRASSNVRLGRPELTGAKTRRSVKLDVTVDDVGGAALGVMSQGELNALALSLFLPRATLPESPFRFVVIDDPVQSMDPARIDGLARVLERAAGGRQVIVFTHDDRLPEAVRRLDITARVTEVTRRAGSVVELREALDPVRRYLQDAFALAMTNDLPAKVGIRIIPGFCRLAIEAACIEVVRKRRLTAGETHQSVEALLEKADRLTQKAALAMFDNPEAGGDVLRGLNKIDRRLANAFQACNKGAHEVYGGDVLELARDTERLTKELMKL